VGGLMSYLRYLCLFVGGLMSYLRYVCMLTDSGVQQISCCLFVFCFFLLLRLVYSMLPVSLNCPFLITLSVFSNVYLLSKNILLIENVNIRYDVILKRFGEFCLFVNFFYFFLHTLQKNMISVFHKEGILIIYIQCTWRLNFILVLWWICIGVFNYLYLEVCVKSSVNIQCTLQVFFFIFVIKKWDWYMMGMGEKRM
jgi:hypothetical protein